MTRLIKQAEAFGSAQVDDDLILIDLHSGKFSSLSGPALRIWQLLDETGDLDAICATLVDEFDVERARCEAEVASFADQLVSSGFAKFV